MFPYFEVFGRIIGSYGLCAIVGLLVCGIVASALAGRYQIAYEDIILTMVVIGGSLLIGGHFLFGITNTNKVIALLKEASSYSFKEIMVHLGQYFGGMVYYGGFLGACAGLFIYTKYSKCMERGFAFDLYAVSIPLFHVFGRIGCFLSGCCYGIESSFGFVVHGNKLIPELNDVRRLPVPLLEAACNLLIFFVLLRMFLKEREKGKLIWYYMLLYPVARFALEFFRGDAIRGFLFGLSTSQWISIVLFAVAIWKLFLAKTKGKKTAVCAGLLLMTLFVAGASPKTVYATEAVEQEAVTGETQEDGVVAQPDADTESPERETQNSAGTDAETTAEEDYGFNGQEKFIIFVCCLSSVVFCVVVGLWGNPNDRLKDKYKRAKKQQMLQEKKRKEQEERAARRAAEEAKYAEELAQYEADMKAYEEEKAAKKAAKEAKKAERLAKKK